MSQVATNDIFQAIKKDDLVLFSSLVEGNENLSFGRFPLLSVCYLYGAKKIIKKYKSILQKNEETGDFKIVVENFEIYKKFKEKAGRCLRLFLADGFVSSIEMLAILHKDFKVKKEFKNCQFYQKNAKIVRNLEQIYQINSQNTKIQDKKITISRIRMGRCQKRMFKTAFALSSIFLVVFSSLFCVFNFVIGWGTSGNPFKLYDQSQFLSAVCGNGVYALETDINLDSNLSIKIFSGMLDGQGHTIYVDFEQTESLIGKNEGKLKNLNIVYKQNQMNISTSFGLFVNENNGVIANVNIVCENLSLNFQKTQESSFFTAFATINNGTISNSSLKMKAEITTSLSGDLSVAGFVGENNGMVENCKFNQGNLTANETDLAGIVCENLQSGNVVGCKNYATLSQTSEIDGWSPNVGGIVLANHGAVKDSVNFGNLSVVSSNVQETASGTVFVGGIVAQNFGKLEKCLNKSDLTAKSQNLTVYCGGVSAYSYTTSQEEEMRSEIENCGEQGNIDALSQNGKVFCGGFVGFLYGNISNCFSVCSFENAFEQDKNCAGTFIGASYLQLETIYSGQLYFGASNNYVLTQDKTGCQVGAMIIVNENEIFGYKKGDNYGASNIDSSYVSNVSTLEQIKELEIYWDEE